MKNCKIDLFGVPYEVKTEIESQRIKDLKGRIYFDDQTIVINNKFPEETQKATLLHEIVHKVLEHTGIERDLLLNNKIDFENATELIASSLFNVMMSNKQLFREVFFDSFQVLGTEETTTLDMAKDSDSMPKEERIVLDPEKNPDNLSKEQIKLMIEEFHDAAIKRNIDNRHSTGVR